MVIRALILSVVIGCTPILIAETAKAMDKNVHPVKAPTKFDVIQQEIDALEAKLLDLQEQQTNLEPKIAKTETLGKVINPKYIIFDNQTVIKSESYSEDLGLKIRRQPDMYDQDSSQMQQQSVEPWEPQGYEQSVNKAKRTYRTEEKAKCSKKLYYYTTKYEMHPKNEFYKYKLDYWLKKCK